MKEKKSTLTEALARMAMAYADMKTEGSNAQFDTTLKRLKAWVDIDSSDKHAVLVLQREMQAGRYGLVLKLLNKLLSKEIKDSIRPMTKADILKKRAEVYEKLGYTMLVEYDQRTRMIACPKSFAPF